MSQYNTLGDRIKELRQALSLSQTELAKKLHCTQAALSQYEKGNREPGLQELANIAIALNTSTDYLLGITHIKTVDINTKNMGDYLGMTEDTIQKLHSMYWKYKEKVNRKYVEKEVKSFTGAVPGDKTYEEDFQHVLKNLQMDLMDYIKCINEFICSSAFENISRYMFHNLNIERTIYDLLHVVTKQYDHIESQLLTDNIVEKAYSLSEVSEDIIRDYSLNIFDIQTTIVEFCKQFTNLERIKELDNSEEFFRKLHYHVYHITHPMFESNDFSIEKLDEALTKDEFKVADRALKILKACK